MESRRCKREAGGIRVYYKIHRNKRVTNVMRIVEEGYGEQEVPGKDTRAGKKFCP